MTMLVIVDVECWHAVKVRYWWRCKF